MMKKNGFTLMEVCVALAVLAAGVAVFGRYLDGFNRLRNLEQNQAQTVMAVAQSIELLVASPPSCRDSSFVLNGVEVALNVVPGVKPLAWVQASVKVAHPVLLRRLVRCQKIR